MPNVCIGKKATICCLKSILSQDQFTIDQVGLWSKQFYVLSDYINIFFDLTTTMF